MRRGLVVVLAGAASLLLGQQCLAPEAKLESPRDDALVDDPLVLLRGRVGPAADIPTIRVLAGNVDLLTAFGVEPPVAGLSGVVTILGSPVVVSGFSVDRELEGGARGPWRAEADLAGLPTGSFRFEIRAINRHTGELMRSWSDFSVVSPFTQEAHALGAGGPRRAEALPGGTVLQAATLGGAFAAEPVGLAGGGELRSGFVEVSEARIEGGAP